MKSAGARDDVAGNLESNQAEGGGATLSTGGEGLSPIHVDQPLAAERSSCLWGLLMDTF